MWLQGDNSLFRENTSVIYLGIKTNPDCGTEENQGDLQPNSMRISGHHLKMGERNWHQQKWLPGHPCKVDFCASFSSCVNWGKCFSFSEPQLLKAMAVIIPDVFVLVCDGTYLAFHLTVSYEVGKIHLCELRSTHVLRPQVKPDHETTFGFSRR